MLSLCLSHIIREVSLRLLNGNRGAEEADLVGDQS